MELYLRSLGTPKWHAQEQLYMVGLVLQWSGIESYLAERHFSSCAAAHSLETVDRVSNPF